MFLSFNKKFHIYPCNPCKPQFYYLKVGFKGSKLYRLVFVMNFSFTLIVLLTLSTWNIIDNLGNRDLLNDLCINSFTATSDNNRLAFANGVDPDEMAHNELSHQDLRCLTGSLSALHINFFPIDRMLKRTKTQSRRQMHNVVWNLVL